LQAAAVIGREIPLDLLGRMTGLRGEALDDKVRRLQEADLLYESQTFPARRFALKHTLVEKVTYESILAARRRDIHARFIETVEAEHPELLEEFLEHLAEHALLAEAWDKAVRYLLRSAQKALQRSAHNAALSHLQRGLEIMAGWRETPERLRIELEYQKTRGLAWMVAKGWGAPEVSDAYERAEVLRSRLDDRTELFTVLRGRAQYYMISG
jgi:predicted ATPase